MNAIAYLRVSTDDQSNGIEAQKVAIKQWAQRRDAQIVAWYTDFGISGAAPFDKRPALVDALAEIKTGMVLVVSRRDRMARDVVTAATIERLMANKGATVESAAGEGDGFGPDAMLMRTIIDAFAQYERAIIAARTRAALAVKKAKGERTGGLPYGMTEGEGGKLLPCPAELEVIAIAKRYRKRGLSLREVAAKLDSKGILSRKGKKWHPQQISQMVGEA